jgi:lysophospholipase L1-like esterase
MSKHGRIVLTIGDSNGAAADGWPVWLRQLIAADVFINNAQGGRTLGFDNPDVQHNGLANIDHYIDEATAQAGKGVDDVVVLLGTNDCKACFDKRLGEVEANLRMMVEKIRKHDNAGKWSPRVVIVTPLPYGRDERLLEKYHGAEARARRLASVYRLVAKDLHCKLVDAHGLLEHVWERVSPDGVHMNEEGQKMLAKAIFHVMSGGDKPL